jgi:hypothetical protein
MSKRRLTKDHKRKIGNANKNNEYRGTLEERFWKKVIKTDYCWEWKGSRRAKAYGLISVNGKMVGAHRVSWIIHNGPIPKGMVVRHYVCDNPCCVNPNHLKLGTKADNANDILVKGRYKYGLNRTPPEVRFWKNVVKQEDGCWYWVGTKRAGGYGVMSINKKTVATHRYSWELHNGPIPKGMIVRHYVCDNPACVNPDHLKLGTRADNTRDMHKKKREARGESLSNLTDKDVLNLRNRYREGKTLKQIAKEFNLSTSSVSLILKGKNWKHVAEKDGGNILNRYQSKEWKESISKAQKGKKLAPEHREKLKEAAKKRWKNDTPWNKGKPMSEETKAKISKSRMGRNKGKKLSKEHCEAISKGRKGIQFTEEHRKNLSKSHMGNKPSKETRSKMSVSQKARYDKI